MDEYIDREELIRQIICSMTEFVGAPDDVQKHDEQCNYAIDMIEDAPTADVVPVVHGRWDDSGRYTFPGGSTAVRCTNCGCALTVSEYHLNNWNYCPVCGAKMDGGDSDEAD